NRSMAERWRKWRRRQPGTLPWGVAWYLTVAALITAAGLALAYHRQRLDEIRADLTEGQRLRIEHRFSEAVRTRGSSLQRSASLPAAGKLTEAMDSELRLARRGQKADALHRLADLVRFRYGLNPPAGGEASNLVRDVRAIWREKDLLLGSREGGLD